MTMKRKCRRAPQVRLILGYETNFMLTTQRIYSTRFASSLMRGVSGDDPEGGAGSGVPRLRRVPAGRGRSGTPPARHDDLAARSSLHGSGGNAGDGSAAPGRKSPRWSAERRASRVMGRAAPHQRGWSRLASATTTQVRLSALRPPLAGSGAKGLKTNPGADT